MRRVVLPALLACPLAVAAQPPEPSQSPSGQPPAFAQKVDVVAVTPIHGLGVPKLKVPANVQAFTADGIGASFALDAPSLLAERATSVHIVEAQGGIFQPDLLFRGFVGSPLLGASEGLACIRTACA